MRLVELVHDILSAQLQPGDRALDATAGNGYDCTCMAQLVGSEGHVIAIDIQDSAIAVSRARLEAAGCLARRRSCEGAQIALLQIRSHGERDHLQPRLPPR